MREETSARAGPTAGPKEAGKFRRLGTLGLVLGLSWSVPLAIPHVFGFQDVEGSLLLANLALVAVAVGLAVVLAWRPGLRPAEMGLRLTGVGPALLACAPATLALVALLLCAQGCLAWLGHPGLPGARPPPTAGYLAFYALVSCPAQELLYRGLAFALLRRAGLGHPGVAVPVSALAYTGLHLLFPSIPGILPASFVLGLVWGTLYQRFSSVWATALSHAVVGTAAISLGLA